LTTGLQAYSILYSDKIQKCLVVAIAVMLFANVAAQIVIAGGGPGACVGFVFLPLWGVIVSLVCAYTTRCVKAMLKKGQKK